MPLRSRRFQLGLALAGLVPAFLVTHLIVGQYKAQRLRLAREWSTRGVRDLASRPAVAVIDFQTALAYGQNRATDRLRLSQALIAARRPAEARAQLLTLWADTPSDGEINLRLARLSAASDGLSDAVRYYHAAIDGSWGSGAMSARRQARLELARWLLAHGRRLEAQSELVALIDDLPSDSALMTEVGGLLADAGADGQALTLLRRALTLDPANAIAARRAGRLAYRAGEYGAARSLFSTAASHGALDAETAAMSDVSDRVLGLDPSARGLSARRRAQRVRHALTIAESRFMRCQMHAPVDGEITAHLNDLRMRLDTVGRLRGAVLQRDPDRRDRVMALVVEIEALPREQCGDASLDDRALQLIAEPRRPAAR